MAIVVASTPRLSSTVDMTPPDRSVNICMFSVTRSDLILSDLVEIRFRYRPKITSSLFLSVRTAPSISILRSHPLFLPLPSKPLRLPSFTKTSSIEKKKRSLTPSNGSYLTAHGCCPVKDALPAGENCLLFFIIFPTVYVRFT